jgi:hypothetical protein
MPSLNTGNAILSNPIKVETTAYNVGIGGAASSSFKLQVTGTTNLTGALTGTSASFSSSVTATKIITTGGNGAEIFNASTATTGSNYFNIRNTGAILFFGIENSTGGGLQTGASAYASVLTTGNATDLSLGTGQVERMVIKATTGNVGIGNTNNTYKLHVTGNIRSSETVLVGNGAAQTELIINSLGGTNQ